MRNRGRRTALILAAAICATAPAAAAGDGRALLGQARFERDREAAAARFGLIAAVPGAADRAYHRALAALQAQVAARPDDGDAWSDLVDCQLELGRHDDARATAAAAARLDPDAGARLNAVIDERLRLAAAGPGKDGC